MPLTRPFPCHARRPAGIPRAALTLGAALPCVAVMLSLTATAGLACQHGAEKGNVSVEADASEPAIVEPTAVVERRLALMGTRLHLRIEAADRSEALRASERAVRALESAEDRLSTWRSGTELARLNGMAPGERQPLSPELAGELEAALACSLATSGAFDPTLGALAAAWGLREGGRQPSEGERRRALAATGIDGLELRRATAGSPAVAVRHRDGLVLDEGGFGKGAGLRAALAALEETGATSAALDLGGQWAFWRRSSRSGKPVWRVAVAHPLHRHRSVAAITVEGGSVATSGNGERGIVVDGHPASHLIDPRDGRPAEDFGSLTVWASDPLRADCLSTGLYVLGPDAALAWASRHPGVEVLVLSPNRPGGDLRARATPGLAARLDPLIEELRVEAPQGAADPLDNDLQVEVNQPKREGTTAFKRPASEPSPPKSRAVEDRATSQEEYTCRP